MGKPNPDASPCVVSGTTRVVSVVLAMLLAVTMVPAAGLPQAFADEPAGRPATSGGDVALEGASGSSVDGAPIADGTEFAAEGIHYEVADGAATLVGFEDGASLEGALVVPETVTDGTGTATVKAVEVADGQVAEGVTSLTLPQAVENVKTEGLAAALPALASIEVAAGAAGSEGGAAGKAAYSSVAGMLFRSAAGQASSDGEAFAEDALELVWAPPAMVVARIPLECKAIAAGAFVDAASLETVMSFGKMESIASAELDGEGNVTKPGAFADEQIARLTIVVPGTNYAVTGEGAERVSGSVALSEKTDMLEKRKAWFHHGFDTSQIIMGAPFGEIEGVNAVSDEGVMEDRSLVTPLENGKSHLELTPEEEAEKAARRGEDPEAGLSFSYQASMDLSVRWAGDRSATPAHVEIPAYAKVDGVTYQVTQIEPNAFESAVFLASAAIPEGVTAIGESAFAGCTNLKSVQLPSTLKTIDYAAFKGCAALESVDIPDSVRWIGGEAFEGCEGLEMLPAVNGGFGGSQLVNQGEADDLAGEGEFVEAYRAGEQFSGIYYTYEEDHLPAGYTNMSSMSADERTLFLHRDGRNFVREPLSLAELAGMSYPEDHSYRHGEIWWVESRPLSNATLWFDPSELGVFYLGHVSDAKDVSNIFRYVVDAGLTDGDVRTRVRIMNGVGCFDNSAYVNEDAQPTFETLGNWEAVKIAPGETPLGLRSEGVALPAGKTIAQIVVPVLLNSYDIAYDDVTTSASPGGTLRVGKYTVEDSNHRLTDPGERPGYRFQGWTGPGYSSVTPTANVDLRTAVAALGEGETELKFEGHWEKTSTATFNTGTGQHFDNVSYYKGDAPALPATAQRTGFWFAGWYPSTGTGYWADKQDGHTLYNGNMPADAYGDVTFNAVWTPKTYTVRYDTEASKDKDGNRVVNQPQNKTFVHPTAANSINQATGLTFGIGADGTVAADLNVVDNHYFDLTNVRQSWCTDYALDVPERKLGAYPFVGWCKIDDLVIGTVPGPSEGGNQRYWTELREKDADGNFTDTHYFFAIFGEGWSDFSKDQCATPYTVYGVWGSTSEATISLKATQPSRLDNLGDQVVTAAGSGAGDELGNATRGTEQIRFRENHGFIGQAEASADSAAEGLHTGTPERRGEGYELDADMNLKAPVRYGFEFLGWGAPSGAAGSGLAANEDGASVASTTDVADVDGKLYIAYDEDAARAGGTTGFTLTGAGAALVNSDNDAGTHVYTGSPSYDAATRTDAWSAYWATRAVDVTMRIPSHAVKDVDFAGESTKAGHPQDADHPYNTKADYTFTWTDEHGATQTWEYAWREGTSGETGGGATAGWYITDKRWDYFDVLEYPAFDTQRDRYTYDGWYEMIKSSMTDSTDKALADLEAAGSPAMRTPIATYENLVQPNTRVRVTGLAEPQGGLTIDENYFLTGVGKDDKGRTARTLWLWTSPIRINVASPVGVYLCTTNSYGQAVEPYVVGNDRRTQLEAQAEFQVATGSHDLQLVGVTAEDVTSFGYELDADGNVVRTDDGANAPVVDVESVESGEATPGMADKILNPKFGDAVGSKDAAVKYGDETSRMFWVSPVPTATADQTGVVYGSTNSTAADEAAKVPGSGSFGTDEGALVPDVEKRRYFGFGYKAGGSGDSDNRIEDELDSSASSGKEYALGDFVLRRHDNYESGEKDGLALVKHDDASGASTYRFYYGLDMRRCDFDLTGLQDIIDNSRGTLEYNSTFDQPLLRVKFTFAAARNPGISYYAARGADEAAGAGVDAGAMGLPDDVVITVGSAS